MDRLTESVRSELSRFGAQAEIARIAEAWPSAVGEQIAQNAWPARIARDGTLHVHTSSSTWAFELEHLTADIRGRLGELAPPKLRFAPGPLPEAETPPAELSENARVSVSLAEREAGAELAAAIEDEKLRKLVARAASASLARARSDRKFC